MSKLKAGIIGLGVGEAHIEGYQLHPECEVLALCDRKNEKRKEAGKKYPGIKIRESADEILNDPEINVVSIASYDDEHYEQIIKSLEMGKHVFVEKPLCLEESHAHHIQEVLSNNPSLKLSSNLILRRYPRFIRLKEMIMRGDLGELFLIEGDYNYGRLEKITEGWRGALEFYSVVYGGGIHIIDLMHWVTGDKIIEVNAFGNNVASRGSQFKFNDLVVCLLKFKSGLVGKMSVNFGCVYPHFHPFQVYGTQGTFVNALDGAKKYTTRDPKAKPEVIEEPYPGTDKGGMLFNFVNSISGQGREDVTAKEVFDAMSVCFAIERAIETSQNQIVQYAKESR